MTVDQPPARSRLQVDRLCASLRDGVVQHDESGVGASESGGESGHFVLTGEPIHRVFRREVGLRMVDVAC